MLTQDNPIILAIFFSKGHSIRPDLLADSDPSPPPPPPPPVRRRHHRTAMMRRRRFMYQPEDPHRRRYKLALATAFLAATAVNFVLDVAFQVRAKSCKT